MATQSRGWGYGPSGGLGLILLVVVILFLTGLRVPRLAFGRDVLAPEERSPCCTSSP
jgi:hypothetical protein